jgi:hypothetical protein
MCFFLIFSPFSLSCDIADSDFFLACHCLCSLFSISPLFRNLIKIPFFYIHAHARLFTDEVIVFAFTSVIVMLLASLLLLVFLLLLASPPVPGYPCIAGVPAAACLHGTVNAVSCITVLFQGPCYGWLPCC